MAYTMAYPIFCPYPIGAGKEKGQPWRFYMYCIFDYHFSETEIPIGHQLVNLSTTKKSQSQRSPIFTAAFGST